MKLTILGKNLGDWLSRKLWRHVLFLSAAGILLAGVSLFKGWLHQQVGFDGEGRSLSRRMPGRSMETQPSPVSA